MVIENKFKNFHPIKDFFYDFPGWEKLFNNTTESDTSNITNESKTNLKGDIGTYEDVVTTLMTPPNTEIPEKIENKLILKLGVMGHLSISFTNVEGGIYAGVFISGDTSLDMSKPLAKYPVDKFSKIEICENEKLLNINLKAFEAPPITIGVLSLKFSTCGGIEIPASVTLNGTVTTNFYAGFTGFYAVGFDVGANLGCTYKIQKIFGISIPYSIKIYCDPYADGDVINETASYVGPVSKITTIPGVKLQSGTFEINIKPSVYLEPGITVANCIYGGLKIASYIELGGGARLGIDDSQQLPKKLDLYSKFDVGIQPAIAYGLKFTIPIINKKISITNTLDLDPISFVKKTENIFLSIKF